MHIIQKTFCGNFVGHGYSYKAFYCMLILVNVESNLFLFDCDRNFVAHESLSNLFLGPTSTKLLAHKNNRLPLTGFQLMPNK